MTDPDKPHYIPSTEILLLVIFPTVVSLLIWAIDVQIARPFWARVLIVGACGLFWFRQGRRWLERHTWREDERVRACIFRWLLLYIPASYAVVYYWQVHHSQAAFNGMAQFVAFIFPTAIVLNFYEDANE